MSIKMMSGRCAYRLAQLAVVVAGLVLMACGGGGESAPGRFEVTSPVGSTPSGPPPVACVIGSTPAITLATPIASRTSGVAPLAVFFDATGTIAGAAQKPFKDLEYHWNFDANALAAAGSWSQGTRAGASKRTAKGPLAAHVFETPGIYTVCVTVTDGVNTADGAITITVLDPEVVFAGASTVCFSASGTFNEAPCDAPSTVQVTTTDFTSAINSHKGPGKRLLFRRGESWDAATSAVLDVAGPGTVGAYGASATKPLIRMTGNTIILLLASVSNPNIGDWRIMDLEFDGMSNPASGAIRTGGGANQITILRAKMRDMHIGVNFFPGVVGQTAIWSQLTMADSEITNIIGGPGGYGAFLAAERLALLGNLIDDVTNGEHVVRTPLISKGVISHNTLSRPAPGKHVLKLHAEDFINGFGLIPAGTYTEKAVVSDNIFVGAAGVDWTVGVGPQDDFIDQRVRDVIVERNWFRAGSGTQVALIIWADEITVRNNICDMTGSGVAVGTSLNCFFVGKRGISPAPTEVRFHNNTCYAEVANLFRCADVEATATNIAFVNNLAYAPNSANPVFVRNQGSPSVTVAPQNTSNADMKNTFPNFADPTPVTPAEFRLSAGSYALNAGAPVATFSDFFELQRPQGGQYDLGATEQ